ARRLKGCGRPSAQIGPGDQAPKRARRRFVVRPIPRRDAAYPTSSSPPSALLAASVDEINGHAHSRLYPSGCTWPETGRTGRPCRELSIAPDTLGEDAGLDRLAAMQIRWGFDLSLYFPCNYWERAGRARV